LNEVLIHFDLSKESNGVNSLHSLIILKTKIFRICSKQIWFRRYVDKKWSANVWIWIWEKL